MSHCEIAGFVLLGVRCQTWPCSPCSPEESLELFLGFPGAEPGMWGIAADHSLCQGADGLSDLTLGCVGSGRCENFAQLLLL